MSSMDGCEQGQSLTHVLLQDSIPSIRTLEYSNRQVVVALPCSVALRNLMDGSRGWSPRRGVAAADSLTSDPSDQSGLADRKPQPLRSTRGAGMRASRRA